jgi:hypothetical protein
VEYYSVIKNEIISFPGKWMQMEDIMLGEVSQVQKDKCCIFSHMWRIDPNTNTNIMHIYEHVSKSGTVRGD